MALERDQGVDCDWDTLTVRTDRERLLIRKLGEIGLGDRWSGELRVRGNELFIGRDRGWFTSSGGTGGGWLSHDRKDRLLKIEAGRH